MLGVKQVNGVRGGGRGLGGVGGQGGGVGGQVGLPGVTQGQGEGRRRPPGGAGGGAAGQEPPQGPLQVTHEQGVDDGVHGAVAVPQPGEGVEEGEGYALAHCLGFGAGGGREGRE